MSFRDAPPASLSNSPRHLPLRMVLIVPFVLQLVLLVSVTTGLSLRAGHQAVEDVTANLRSELSRRIGDYLTSYLDVPHQINALNAASLALGELDATDAHALGRHFWHQLQQFETVSFLFFATPEGGAAGAGRLEDGRLVVDTTPVDPDRGLVAGTRYEYLAVGAGERGEQTKATPGFDARQRPWHGATLRAGRPVWSDVYPFFSDRSRAVAATKPLYGPGGTLLGILGADLTLSAVSEFLRGLDVGESGWTLVIDRQGSVLASSTEDETRIEAASRFLSARPGGLAGFTEPTQLDFELGGARQFVHASPILDPRGIDWLTVVVLPEADFMGRIDANIRATIWLCLGALLLAIGLGVFTARRITSPILRLREASRSIADGHLEQAVPTGRIDEIADLAKSFNRMAVQVRESFAVLESRVRERTVELRDAKEDADAANRAKTRFLANMGHEIRSPLATILGYTELLETLSDAAEGDRVHALATIKRAGNHLHRLLGDLLDLSRIEAGRLELQTRSTRLDVLLDDLASAFAARAADKNLDFEIRTEGLLPWRFDTDPTRVRQVLSNLLSNAVRNTPSGRVALHVEVEHEVEDAGGDKPRAAVLVWRVEDTGVGIGAADRERLFQRFTQLKPTRSEGVGFGLGLAITHQLVELLGGSIEVESEKDKGTRFTIRLPVEACSDWAERDAFARHRRTTETPFQPTTLAGRVLIADDSPDLLELCRYMLGGWGLETTAARDGVEATELALSGDFDAILMDWQMPRRDGLEATRALRRAGVRSPIIAVTAAAFGDDREACLDAGATDYLRKPIHFKALHDLLRDLLAAPPVVAPPVADTELTADAELAALSRRYLGTLPARLDILASALEERDWSTFDSEVHQLAGTAGSYGMTSIFAAAERLEAVGGARDPAAAAIAMGALREALRERTHDDV